MDRLYSLWYPNPTRRNRASRKEQDDLPLEFDSFLSIFSLEVSRKGRTNDLGRQDVLSRIDKHRQFSQEPRKYLEEHIRRGI